MAQIGLILLAAGSSSRMGQPKQLLPIEGDPLLLRTAKVAVASGVDHIVVVLGSGEKHLEGIIQDLPVTIVVNRDWQKGMGNSLKVGLNQLLINAPEIEAVIVSVCDQPKLSEPHLRKLVTHYHKTKNRIISSYYANSLGVPVLFDKSLFQELLSVDDGLGAKKIINRYPESTLRVDFPGGEIDLDTMKDYHTFLAMSKMKLLFCCGALLLSSAVLSQTKDYKPAIAQATDSVQAFLKRSRTPGAAVTVSIDGKTVWSKGFGYADLEQKVRVEPAKTKFRIASISKSITATAIAVLYQQGKIQLDSSIYFYVPTFPAKKYRFTIRQLAGHTAGIRYYQGDEFHISRRYKSQKEGLQIFQDDSLLFKPGTKYQYSSYGFNLLGVALENASGINFIKFVNDQVLQPLQMQNTVPDYNDSIIIYRSRFYDVKDGALINSPFVDNSYKWAGGGYLSTSEDLAKFGNSYLRPGLLRKETIDLFVASQKFPDGTETGYGLGWSSRKDKNGKFVFGHSGGGVGGSSDLVVYPIEKIVVVILTNISGAGIGNLTHDLATLFMK